MRNYWLKIVLGALGVFGIGMVVMAAFHSVRHKVREVKDSASPLEIPLPFGIAAFRLDGDRLGSLQRIRLERESPKVISSVTIWAKLDDSVSADRLEGCRFAATDVEHWDEHSTFNCVKDDTAGLAPFGSVEIDGESYPLLLPQRVIDDMHGGHSRNARVWVNDSIDIHMDTAEYQVLSDSMAILGRRMGELGQRMGEAGRMDTAALRQLNDSMAQLARRMREAGRLLGDSAKRAVQRQIDSIQRANAAPVPPVPPSQ